VRLFVAIHLPPAETERLYRETAALRASELPVRWVSLASLHITLKFLGEVAENRTAEISKRLERVAAGHAPFQLRLNGLGAFPNQRHPRVVWVGTDAPLELLGVQAGVEATLSELGFEREARAWSPHLTLGRARDRARAEDFAALPALAAAFAYESTARVATIDLMQSRLQRGGAEYTRLVAAPLGSARTGN